MLDRRALKEAFSKENISELLKQLGSSPPITSYNSLIFDTVCHNPAGCGSKKLYYYLDTRLFKCYTGCSESFDIFELIKRSLRQKNIDLSFNQCVQWATNNTEFFFMDTINEQVSYLDMDIKREIKFYDDSIINYLPFFPIYDWNKEDISLETMKRYNIKFNPVTSAVIIPHYDINNNLVGIRQRTMVEDEELLGKYRPAYINGKSYPHPLSFNLYGININKDNIEKTKKAIIFEGEKSVLKLDCIDNSCAVACCGSNISTFQIDLLLSLHVEEVVIAFDKEFLESGDLLFQKQFKLLETIASRFSSKVNVSYIFDKSNLLEYKESPIDRGIEIFSFLYERRTSFNEL